MKWLLLLHNPASSYSLWCRTFHLSSPLQRLIRQIRTIFGKNRNHLSMLARNPTHLKVWEVLAYSLAASFRYRDLTSFSNILFVYNQYFLEYRFQRISVSITSNTFGRRNSRSLTVRDCPQSSYAPMFIFELARILRERTDITQYVKSLGHSIVKQVTVA